MTGDPKRILQDTFGFADFRGVQEQVVERVMVGEHTLAVMPTGSGKSLCYQLPALARPGTALIISPLIALMHDQIRSAEAFGIHAASLTATAPRRSSGSGPANSTCSTSRQSGRLPTAFANWSTTRNWR